jgi:hypothetical protein
MSPHNFPQNRSMCNLYSIIANQTVTNACTTSGSIHRQSDEGQQHEGRGDGDVEGKTE